MRFRGERGRRLSDERRVAHTAQSHRFLEEAEALNRGFSSMLMPSLSSAVTKCCGEESRTHRPPGLGPDWLATADARVAAASHVATAAEAQYGWSILPRTTLRPASFRLALQAFIDGGPGTGPTVPGNNVQRGCAEVDTLGVIESESEQDEYERMLLCKSRRSGLIYAILGLGGIVTALAVTTALLAGNGVVPAAVWAGLGACGVVSLNAVRSGASSFRRATHALADPRAAMAPDDRHTVSIFDV